MDSPKYCPCCGSVLSRKYEGGKYRPACPSSGCGYLHFTNVSVGCGGVVLHDQKVLLVQRGLDPGRGSWQIPGGYVEDDEEISSAIEREIYEESGVYAKVEEVIGFRHSANLFGQSPPNLYMIFRLAHSSGTPRFDGVETINAGYFSLSEIEQKDNVQALSLWAIKLALAAKSSSGFTSQSNIFEARPGRTIFGVKI